MAGPVKLLRWLTGPSIDARTYRPLCDYLYWAEFQLRAPTTLTTVGWPSPSTSSTPCSWPPWWPSSPQWMRPARSSRASSWGCRRPLFRRPPARGCSDAALDAGLLAFAERQRGPRLRPGRPPAPAPLPARAAPPPAWPGRSRCSAPPPSSRRSPTPPSSPVSSSPCAAAGRGRGRSPVSSWSAPSSSAPASWRCAASDYKVNYDLERWLRLVACGGRTRLTSPRTGTSMSPPRPWRRSSSSAGAVSPLAARSSSPPASSSSPSSSSSATSPSSPSSLPERVADGPHLPRRRRRPVPAVPRQAALRALLAAWFLACYAVSPYRLTLGGTRYWPQRHPRRPPGAPPPRPPCLLAWAVGMLGSNGATGRRSNGATEQGLRPLRRPVPRRPVASSPRRSPAPLLPCSLAFLALSFAAWSVARAASAPHTRRQVVSVPDPAARAPLTMCRSNGR